MNSYANAQSFNLSAIHAAPDARAQFIRKTYGHLAGAIAAFIGLEALILRSPVAGQLYTLATGGRYNWLMFIGAFMALGWVASSMAQNVKSIPMQYAGLAFYVAAEALFFAPMLYMAVTFAGPTVIMNAGLITLALFAGLTLVVFTTRKDFSFMGSILKVGFLLSIGVIVAGVMFGFNLGLAFSAIMVALASGAILYDTSNILHHYRTDQHVAGALSLFASVALLFWYVLRIVMSFSRN